MSKSEKLLQREREIMTERESVIDINTKKNRKGRKNCEEGLKIQKQIKKKHVM
jgi:hypothetical protein